MAGNKMTGPASCAESLMLPTDGLKLAKVFFVDPIVMYEEVRVSSTCCGQLSQNSVKAQSANSVRHTLDLG